MSDTMPHPVRHFEECATVLLDMDGTLLDLAFDNWFWREAVPRCVARARDASPDEVRTELYAHFARKQGSLDWYCLDYWTAALGVDLRALKAASSHRVRYLPGARTFLAETLARGKRVILVTNAHAHTLAVKSDVAGLGRWFERLVSSHEFGVPKESPDFWPRLADELRFDPEATLFVDDSAAVLDAAADFGLAAVVGIRHPDTRQPPRDIPGHIAVTGVAQLLGDGRPAGR